MTPNDQPESNESGKRLIATIELPAEAFGLATVLQQVTTLVVEGEQLVPNWDEQLPYLWATNDDLTAFEDAVADDPTVTRIQQIATFDSGSLYELDWANTKPSVRTWLREAQIPILEAEATAETQDWQLKLRLASRDQLTALQEHCESNGSRFELLHLYTLEAPKMGQYNVSAKQREALLTAYTMGYFETPRECTLSDIAERLDIAPRSVSERMRRGENNLLANTLLIGYTPVTESDP